MDISNRPMGRGKEFLSWLQVNASPPGSGRIKAQFNLQGNKIDDNSSESLCSAESADNIICPETQQLSFEENIDEKVEKNEKFESNAIDSEHSEQENIEDKVEKNEKFEANAIDSEHSEHSEQGNIKEKVEKNEKFEANAIDSEQPKRFDRENVAQEIKEQTRSLPIYSKRHELIDLIKNNQIVIIVGETGSGKSTQIPQYIVDAGLIKDDCMMAITEPRRVAAKSLAERVSLECGVELGSLVGFAVRFDSCTSPMTIIKYMTDGLLVKDFTQDEKKLDEYSIIMIDEAHERSVHTDVAFGLLKRAVKTHPDLKVIISSATLEVEKFSRFFNDAPVFSITGRGYDVEVIYEPSLDYLKDVFGTIVKILESSEKGDILAFVTGQEDIRQVCRQLGRYTARNHQLQLIIVPCHGTLPLAEQQKIFEPTWPGYRKIVISTNVAETSLTVDGIVYVVDCGYVKEKHYNYSTKIEYLQKVRITKFQAIQRQGRAGRTQPGKCYRLYSERLYNEFRDAQKPNIQRSNVQGVILDLAAMGIDDPSKFEFVDAPSEGAIDEALTSLVELSALDDAFNLTRLGRQMAELPLEPSLAKVLIMSAELGCSTDVLKIVAILSIHNQDLLLRHNLTLDEFREKRKVFDQPEGDHLTILEIYNRWMRKGFSEIWCHKHLVHYRYLEDAQNIKEQLTDIMIKNNLLTTEGEDLTPCQPCHLRENICRAFTSGYFHHLGRKCESSVYQKLSSNGEEKNVYVHPTSVLYKTDNQPQWIIFQEVMDTSKTYVNGIAVTDPQWVMEYAPKFWSKVQKNYSIAA